MSALLEAREPSAQYLEAAPPSLVRQFERLAGAPGGVARLRELILTLAVQGKLLAQDPSDEYADRLIVRIHAARSKLIASGRIGKQKPSEPVNEDETAFLLPKGWVWSRVGDLAWPQAGFAFKSSRFNESGLGLPLIRIRDVGASVGPTTFFSGEYRAEFLVEKGDWLISMDGEFRVRPWHATTALLNQRVTRLIFVAEEVHPTFVAAALQRELTALQGTKAYTTVDHLSGKQIGEAVIALPPANEQARIVARVDELMHLCDGLEAKGQLEAEQHARLLDTLLGTLTDSSTPEEQAANWQRVAEHFDLLLDRPEAVDVLEQTILQLAVRGVLVPQDAVDEPAGELLERGRAEKDRLVARGIINPFKPLAAVSDDDHPYELPGGWKWSRLGSIGITSTGGTPPTSRPECFGGEIAFIGPGQISSRGQILTAEKFISELGRQETSIAESGDLLMVCIGGSIGKCAMVHRTTAFNQQINSIRFLFGSSTYLLIAMSSLDFQRQVLGAATGSATPIISKGKWDTLLVPVPPLAEQDRIVARVAELRRVCADLRIRLVASQATQSHLAEALVDSATA